MHYVISKKGIPFLFIPQDRKRGLATIGLYPAQTLRARAVRTLIYAGVFCHIPFPRKALTQEIDLAHIRWRGNRMPEITGEFGVLAGNPNAIGRRCIFLCFDRACKPLCIVKWGCGAAARSKISAEKRILWGNDVKRGGAPAILGYFETADQSGIVLEYIAGRTPGRRVDQEMLSRVLGQWVKNEPPTPLAEIPGWQRLPGDDRCERAAEQRIVPVIYHGDFAPWNIIIDKTGVWRVLDWERGEPVGVPGWDWFHYVVQVECLVKRSRPRKVWRRLQETMAHPAFQAYAEQTRIKGIEPMILRGYCHHALELLRENRGGKDRERTERVLRWLLAEKIGKSEPQMNTDGHR